MKSILTFLLAAVLVTSLSAQEPDCWHYENGDAPIVGSVETPGSARGVTVAGDYAYVADSGSGLQVIDITEPDLLQIMGSVGTPGDAWGVDFEGGYAYVATSESYDGWLVVIDITNTKSPQIVGIVETPWSASDVAVAGSYAYVAVGGSLQVIDISDPESPVIVGRVNTQEYVFGLAVAGNYAYVANGDSGLQVVDISDPGFPVIVGGVATVEYCWDVAVAGNYAYVACPDDNNMDQNKLRVIDISVPESPELVGAAYTPAEAWGVAVAGSYAYVTVESFGLQVIDISVPASPAFVGAVDIGANDVAVAGNYAYVADGTGLQIAWRQCEDVVSNEIDPDEPVVDDEIPGPGVILSVFPNPFNPQTTVTFSLEQTGWAEIGIYDLTGRQVAILADQHFVLDTHTLTWNGHDSHGRAMPSGTYIVRLETDSHVEARKVMLVR